MGIIERGCGILNLLKIVSTLYESLIERRLVLNINMPPGLLLTFSLNWKPSHNERRRGYKKAEIVNWVVNRLAVK